MVPADVLEQGSLLRSSGSVLAAIICCTSSRAPGRGSAADLGWDLASSARLGSSAWLDPSIRAGRVGWPEYGRIVGLDRAGLPWFAGGADDLVPPVRRRCDGLVRAPVAGGLCFRRQAWLPCLRGRLVDAGLVPGGLIWWRGPRAWCGDWVMASSRARASRERTNSRSAQVTVLSALEFRIGTPGPRGLPASHAPSHTVT